MPGITEIMQKRLMDSIRAVQPPGKWKVVIVDSKSMRILGAACKMYDILEENVTLIENIEKQRQPYPSQDAIYFLTPCRESVMRLIDDFTFHKPPMYKAAHIHFTSGLPDDLFAELDRRLKAANASDYIHSLKDMYVDFMVKEPAVFTIEPEWSYHVLYEAHPNPEKDQVLRDMAKQLLSVCATLGEDPIIRYQAPPSEDSDHGIRNPPSLTRQFATILQKEIDDFCRVNKNFPPPRNPPQPRATMLIVDRRLDVNAPFLHEFTYQAMINDLLPVEDTEYGTGIKYTYSYTQADGSMGSKEVILDESDTVYTSIRHLHIAECTERLIEEFNKFLAENKTAVHSSDRSGPKDAAKSLKDMKEMLSNLPQFQDMKAKYSAHLSIAQECLSIFEKRKLNSVGNVEQNMATGETPEGETPKTIVLDMVPLLDDPYVSQTDKARLLALYIISKEGGIFEDDKHKLLEHAKLHGDLREAINNLTLLGVKTTRTRRKPGEKSSRKKKERRHRSKDEEIPYELSRYIPTLKRVMDNFLSDELDSAQFPYMRQSDMEFADSAASGSVISAGTPASGVSLRTTKPSWSKKGGSANAGHARSSNGARLIIFVIGGLTYSEIRSVYEMADIYNRDIYIGATQVIRPSAFVEDTGRLRLPLHKPRSIIPPYVPPSPPATKTTGLFSHIPHLNHSSSHVSLSGSSTRSGPSPVPDKVNDDKEKKKKKGLKKLFG